MLIADGRDPAPITRLKEGARSTWFKTAASPRSARKAWIAGSLKPEGAIIVDGGAEKALMQGRSLLPAGVSAIEGSFERGDAVAVKNAAGGELARGLCAYDSADAARIKGHKSKEIEELLGYRGRDEMIHRDDLVLTQPRPDIEPGDENPA